MKECVLPINTRIGRPRVRAAALAVLLASLVALPSVAPAQTDQPMMLSVELPDRPTAGARLFAQKSCSRCHSLVGSEPRVGPDLGRILFSGTVLDLAGAFWNHSQVMREKMADLKIQQPVMTATEMANLVAFLTAYRYYLTEVGEPGDPATGRTVFRQKRCAECHSEDGEAFTTLGPNLARYRGRASAVFLAQAMWNHGGEMAQVMAGRGVPWPTFNGSEMGDLVAYLRAGSATSEDQVYFEPGSPSRGRDLFAAKGCLECHAIAGEGGRGGPDLGTRGSELVRSVSEIAGLMWNHSQGMTREFQRRGLQRVEFSGQEMVDIIAYLYFVNYANVEGVPARGSRLFVNKCSTCHAVGGGGRVGPDLVSSPGLDEPIAIITAMWNHAPKMELELKKRGLPWPRFEPGEAADVIAFLLSSRRPQAAVEPRRPGPVESAAASH